MWFQIFLIFFVIHANPFRCSLVIDRAAQEGIYLDDYCPKMPFCPEGAHTMCMYYNPNRIYGPRCSSFQNISVNPEIAEHLLGMVNEMRGRVAMGMETGKGNVTLPRGYGMFQLKWDNELATFAQVLANTCILRRDLCRATKKFPDPGQLASLVRFTIPDWLPVSHQKHFTEKGLTPSKISYAANEAYKVWYRDKQHVSLEMIQEAPDWMTAKSTEGRLFLHLIDGKATHMGCGVSAYVEYKFHGNNPDQIIFNSVHIICNFSSQPKKGTAVYRTDEPTAEDLCPPGDHSCISRYSSKCGCPPDTAEDDRCLCTDPIPHAQTQSCQKDKSCKPAVVLLPIFTVEDAPQHMISRKGMSQSIQTNPTFDEQQLAMSNEWEHNEVLEKYRNKNEPAYDHILKPLNHEPAASCDHKLNSPMDGLQKSSYIMNSIEFPYTKTRIAHLNERVPDEEIDSYRKKQTYRKPLDEKYDNSRNQPKYRDYFDEKYDSIQNQLIHREPLAGHQESRNEKHEKQGERNLQTRQELPKKGVSNRRFSSFNKNKQSIFSRAPRFELHNTGKQIKNFVKMDVAPRKDFSNAKQALDKYLSEKRHKEPTVHDEVQDVDQNIDETKSDTNKLTVTIRPRFKSSVVNSINHHNQHLDRNITKISNKRPSMKQYLKKKFRYLGFNVNDESLNQVDDGNDIKESDRKLMDLLDNLEQEAQHVDLKGSEKEIFDAKLKKIYGSIVKNVDPKVNKFEYSEERLPNFKDTIRDDKSLRYESDYDEEIFYESTDDPNKDDLDKRIYDTEDIITDFHSKDHNYASQSLYAKPLPRDQNTLRPIVEDKMNYVFRNTFNDVYDFKNKLTMKDKRSNRHGIPKLLENKRRNDDEVKTLPYKLQYATKRRRQKYASLNKYKDKQKHYRNDDERGRHINQIHEQKANGDEIMSDYEDDKQMHFINENDKPYGKEHEKDYPEDPLSAERRRFYQEKLDKIKRRKYFSDSKKPGYNRDTGRKRRPLRGLRKNPASGSRRYYLPNRASRHGFKIR